jgi:hypothetical protein
VYLAHAPELTAGNDRAVLVDNSDDPVECLFHLLDNALKQSV